MKLSTAIIKGFRNFKEATINFNEKSLIIGANDVGKTNLLWALRMLLDKGLSEFDIEPKDSDFYAYEEVNEFSITLKFENVTEDCVVAKLKGIISDDNELYLSYKAKKDPVTAVKNYEIYAGHSLSHLEILEERFYRRVINIKYIGCQRDLYGYINREKKNLLQYAKEERTDDEKKADEQTIASIKEDLVNIDNNIPKLHFIKKATDSINNELDKLSFHHSNQKIVFDAGSSEVDKFIGNVSLASKNDDKNLVVGGDGKLNQIFLSLWATSNNISDIHPKEVTIFCIEEPEAHLHPHQQRKLAEYLSQTLTGQVLITTHSPQIVCEFSPNSIIRLYQKNFNTNAASNGCSQIISESFNEFGYRLSIIPSEAFFSNVVFLVEGVSEEIFYKALSRQINLELDRFNISILMVDGVGFETYIKILNALNIRWVLRTDNDIFKIPKKELFRLAGIQRAIKFYRMKSKTNEKVENILKENEKYLTNIENDTNIPPINLKAAQEIINTLSKCGVFIAKKDLENDLKNSEVYEDLSKFCELNNEDEVVELFQKRKATFMYNFIKKYPESLQKIEDSELAAPLYICKKIAEKTNETNRSATGDN